MSRTADQYACESYPSPTSDAYQLPNTAKGAAPNQAAYQPSRERTVAPVAVLTLTTLRASGPLGGQPGALASSGAQR